MVEDYQSGKSEAVSASSGLQDFGIDLPGLSGAQINVLRRASNMTPKIIAEHPEVAGLYFNTDLTQEEIAELVVPDDYSHYPSATKLAVHDAIREILLPEERAEATQRRAAAVGAIQIRKGPGGMQLNEEQFRQRQRERALIAQNNPASKKTAKDALAMIKANGQTPWTDAEKAFARFLKTQPEFQHQDKEHAGKYSSLKIAEALNEAFHGGKEVRSRKSVKHVLVPSNNKASV